MSERILLVDDDHNLLLAMQRVLGAKYDLALAPGGEQALERLARDAPYAVLITDLRMPGMDGITLLEQAQRVSPDTVRIVLSGYGDLDQVMQAINEGYIFRFLTKPATPQQLEKTIQAALEQHQRVLAARETHSLKRLKEALENVVLGFTRLVEARDPYTAGHQERVCQLAVALSQGLGLSEDQVACVRLAALIHDLGKVYVPSEFLNRPGRLTQAEMGIIRTHPQVGCEIMRPLDFQWPMSQIVLQHHERLDGSGYPQGLKGEGILLEARIIAVADVVEAMSSHRPYRPSRGLQGALREIGDQRGCLYDPVVVDACLELFQGQGWRFERQDQWQEQ
ncbi:MAG: HD domain-containing protein [Desulfarculus sp.]|nr:HD domain-containing protein [Desulfarculus sp.]